MHVVAMPAQAFVSAGSLPPLTGKSAAAARFSDPKNGNADPKINVLSWTPDHAELSRDGSLGYTDGDVRPLGT